MSDNGGPVELTAHQAYADGCHDVAAAVSNWHADRLKAQLKLLIDNYEVVGANSVEAMQ